MTNDTGQTRIPVVGIGASAGGLEALEAFFEATPPGVDAAFVIVQHMLSDKPSLLPNLLKNCTTMPIQEAEDGMALTVNQVYVIPPGRGIKVQLQQLVLLDEVSDNPIDTFFKSLALNDKTYPIGILLSGTGTDGVPGLQLIREHGGLTIAQRPESASYPGMPRAAIEQSAAEITEKPSDIHQSIKVYIDNLEMDISDEAKRAASDQEAIEALIDLIHQQIGHDFSNYKPTTLKRRISRRMAIKHIHSLQHYYKFARSHPDEVKKLFNDLLIGVTRFFRDPHIYDALDEYVFPAITENCDETGIRIWVPGCATGEEAYSIAIQLHRYQQRHQRHCPVQIFATDINASAIQTARYGSYPDYISESIPDDILQEHFIAESKGYRIQNHIRSMLIFAEHNIIHDPPFSNIDLVSFRNVMIYFQRVLQRRTLDMFHYALKPEGYLLLGTSETVDTADDRFEIVDKETKIYRTGGDNRAKIPHVMQTDTSQPQTPDDTNSKENETLMPDKIQLQAQVERILLTHHTASAVLTDADGEILYFHNRTGDYLEPVTGDARLNIFDMAREGLRIPLTAVFQTAVMNDEIVTREPIIVQINGDEKTIRLTAHPLQTPDNLAGHMLILFTDRSQYQSIAFSEDGDEIDYTEMYQQRIEELESDLGTTRAYLNATTDDLQAANEDLKSTNEELQPSAKVFPYLAEYQLIIDCILNFKERIKLFLCIPSITIIFVSYG